MSSSSFYSVQVYCQCSQKYYKYIKNNGLKYEQKNRTYLKDFRLILIAIKNSIQTFVIKVKICEEKYP